MQPRIRNAVTIASGFVVLCSCVSTTVGENKSNPSSPGPAADSAAQARASSIAKPARAPDVVYEPSPMEAVRAMLELAQVGPHDVVYDLGSGDGRIVIAAVKERGASGVGIDIDPYRVAQANANARQASVSSKAKFIEGDLFETDFSSATVITMFLSPQVNMKLRPKLQALKSGTRIVSYVHDLGDWQPRRSVITPPRARSVYLWVVP